MVDSFSLIGFLPDYLVIWIQFGTRYFIDYIYLIIGIPLLVDFLIVWSPKLGMSFGSNADAESEGTGSAVEAETINTVNLDDKFKFMYVYARNPNLFQSKESVENFDAEISKMKKSFASGSKGSGTSTASESKAAAAKKTKTQGKNNITYSFTDRLLKSGLTTLHLSFIAVVILVNIAGYWHYSSIVDKFFTLSDRGYSINYQVLDAATIEDREEVFNMYIKLEQINEIKYPEKR
jgi:hypothetical protein